MQRGIDTAAELSDVVAQKLNSAADPRAKQLRKRKWALWLGVFFTVSCLIWVGVTILLATWDTPAWAIVHPDPDRGRRGVSRDAVVPALPLAPRRTLPPQRSRATRRLPPWGSAARQSMAALAASERGLFSLISVMERGKMLPAGELRELVAVANQSSATMAATANEVVSMERAIANAPQSRAHLAPTIAAFTAQLDNGARQYNEMVTAAAQLVSAANTGPMSSSPMSQQRYRDELVNATDRLTGWAQAFDELGQLRRA